jgi:hypothetical protein
MTIEKGHRNRRAPSKLQSIPPAGFARRGGPSSERRSRSPSPSPSPGPRVFPDPAATGDSDPPRVVSSQSRRCVLTGLHPARSLPRQPTIRRTPPAAGETWNTTCAAPQPRPLREQQPARVQTPNGIVHTGTRRTRGPPPGNGRDGRTARVPSCAGGPYTAAQAGSGGGRPPPATLAMPVAALGEPGIVRAQAATGLAAGARQSIRKKTAWSGPVMR